MRVKKRDGSSQDIDITKIQKQTHDACKGLDGVSQSELELDAQIQFTDGILTSKIQETLIRTASDKTTEKEPNWTFVAARLFLYDLYKRASGKNRKFLSFKEYIERTREYDGFYHGVSDGFDIEALGKAIDHKRDMLFNYLGIKTLYDKYLIKDKNGTPLEYPQYMFMGIAMYMCGRAYGEEANTALAIEVYNRLSKFEMMLATPTLSGARRKRHQLSSCFVMSLNDSLEGIMGGIFDMARISKYGGGIGVDVTKIRAGNEPIDGNKNASSGIIPFMKIINDTALAVNQLGVRRGAIAVYLEVWHTNIEEFIDLRKNSGDERMRAHDLFPAVWLNDLFMSRVEEDKDWALFSPNAVPALTETFGEDFKRAYERYEADKTIKRTTIKAKDLWKRILRAMFEQGMPFLGFKDTANRRHSNMGIIRSSNLCSEIFQITNPTDIEMVVNYLKDSDVKQVTLKENNKLTAKDQRAITKLGYIPRGGTKDITPAGNSSIIQVYKQSAKNGNVAVCNLGSINISKFKIEDFDLVNGEPSNRVREICSTMVRVLDNGIDRNMLPTIEAQKTNTQYRAIGIGFMGEAEFLATNHIYFGSDEHKELANRMYEILSYCIYEESVALAEEKGAYPAFKNTANIDKIFPLYTTNNYWAALLRTKWDMLKEKVKYKGIRNAYLMAIAPTSTISILCGTSQTVEPIYRKRWVEDNISGIIPVTAPNLTEKTSKYYTPAFNVKQINLVEVAGIRQNWIDQGQSINIFLKATSTSGRELSELYMKAWKVGLKSTYYLRSESPDVDSIYEEKPVNREIECSGCQ